LFDRDKGCRPVLRLARALIPFDRLVEAFGFQPRGAERFGNVAAPLPVLGEFLFQVVQADGLILGLLALIFGFDGDPLERDD
jgi:hypothetical protein